MKKFIILITLLLSISTYSDIVDEFGDSMGLDIKREKQLIAPVLGNVLGSVYIKGEIVLTKQNILFVRIHKKTRRTNTIYDIDSIKVNGERYKLYVVYNNNNYCCYAINLEDIDTNKILEYTILHNGNLFKNKI